MEEYEKQTLNSNSAPISKPVEPIQISEEEQKNKIKKNYLPDLSNYQQISFTLKNKMEKKKNLL